MAVDRSADAGNPAGEENPASPQANPQVRSTPSDGNEVVQEIVKHRQSFAAPHVIAPELYRNQASVSEGAPPITPTNVVLTPVGIHVGTASAPPMPTNETGAPQAGTAPTEITSINNAGQPVTWVNNEAFTGESERDPALEREIFDDAIGEGAAKGARTARAPTSPRRRARTTIGKAVLTNRAAIDLIAASFLVLIDERLESIRAGRSNSEEADAARDQLEDLKRRVEEFLGATSIFATTKKTKEEFVVKTTTSFATGIGNWWSKRHVQICDRSFEMGLFGIGVTICLLAGTGGILAAAIPGAMVGGKPIVDVIKAYNKTAL